MRPLLAASLLFAAGCLTPLQSAEPVLLPHVALRPIQQAWGAVETGPPGALADVPLLSLSYVWDPPGPNATLARVLLDGAPLAFDARAATRPLPHDPPRVWLALEDPFGQLARHRPGALGTRTLGVGNASLAFPVHATPVEVVLEGVADGAPFRQNATLDASGQRGPLAPVSAWRDGDTVRASVMARPGGHTPTLADGDLHAWLHDGRIVGAGGGVELHDPAREVRALELVVRNPFGASLVEVPVEERA